MKVVKIKNDVEELYFKNPQKAANYLGVSRSSVQQSLLVGCRCKGYYVEVTNEPDIVDERLTKIFR